jgi:hypothetical protein
MVDIPVGFLVHPLACFPEKIVAPAERESLHWAVGYTRRLLALVQPLPTEVTLLDLGIGTVVLELGYIERTGHHAESAAHAFVLPPDYRSLICL